MSKDYLDAILFRDEFPRMNRLEAIIEREFPDDYRRLEAFKIIDKDYPAHSMKIYNNVLKEFLKDKYDLRKMVRIGNYETRA